MVRGRRPGGPRWTKPGNKAKDVAHDAKNKAKDVATTPRTRRRTWLHDAKNKRR